MNYPEASDLRNNMKPVNVEHLPGDVVVIEGVRYSGDFFRTVAMPNEDVLYSIRKEDDLIHVKVIRDAHEAKIYFDEIFLSNAVDEMENEDAI